MRIALGLEYLGTRYLGWQRQEGQDTVQTRVENALAQIAGVPINTICAGRTDAGVHARGQVVHFEVEVQRPEKAWVMGTNTHLPRDIRVTWMREVPDTFHARFSAVARTYRYTLNNRSVPPAIEHTTEAWYAWPLDADRMHQAAQILIGEHDFSAFRAANCQSKTPYRCVFAIQVLREGNKIFFDISANAFLYHMVRNLVGTLIWIGSGRRSVTWLSEVLVSKDRRKAGTTAPAQGLCLEDVSYGELLGFSSG